MATLTRDIDWAKRLLDDGSVVAIPTETVYGLAAKGTDPEALQKIFKTKGRPSNNPLILHFSDLTAMTPYIAEVSKEVRLLAAHFWPGPLTLLLPKTTAVPDMVTAGSQRVAVRVPNHPLTLALLHNLDYPLAAPSANRSGYISPTQPAHVAQQLGTRIPLILDGGACQQGLESTILGWENGQPTIYREGMITAHQLGAVLGDLPTAAHRQKVLVAPGMSSSHYAPVTQTLVSDNLPLTLESVQGKTIGLISLAKPYVGPHTLTKEIVLSTLGSLEEIAQRLYAAMYELDQADVTVIIIERAPNTGIGKAINDRLQRSAHRSESS
ncbi:MAG: L-threonylcarbamoyladenylate synthase [Bacteroidota bacterium]